MSAPRHISEIIIKMASDPRDDFGKVLRRCPFIREELLRRGLARPEDLAGGPAPRTDPNQERDERDD